MLNLLTEEQKRKVVGEYKKRVWTAVSLGIIGVIVISSTFLIPVYVMSYGTYTDALRVKTDLDSRITASQKGATAENIKDLAMTITILQEYSVTVPPSKLVEAVVSAKPSGVKFSHISYTPSQNDPATIDVIGRAGTRGDLVIFSNNLKADPHFGSVYIPISNFAKDKDIQFSVKLIASSTPHI